MKSAAFLDDIPDEIRIDAQVVADRNPGELAALIEILESRPELAEFIHTIALRVVRDLATGLHPVYTTTESEVTPAEAARMLGVSRQFLDRQLAAGKLEYKNKPGSTHRVVTVDDVLRFALVRDERRAGTRKAIDALLDGGADY